MEMVRVFDRNLFDQFRVAQKVRRHAVQLVDADQAFAGKRLVGVAQHGWYRFELIGGEKRLIEHFRDGPAA